MKVRKAARTLLQYGRPVDDGLQIDDFAERTQEDREVDALVLRERPDLFGPEALAAEAAEAERRAANDNRARKAG